MQQFYRSRLCSPSLIRPLRSHKQPLVSKPDTQQKRWVNFWVPAKNLIAHVRARKLLITNCDVTVQYYFLNRIIRIILNFPLTGSVPDVPPTKIAVLHRARRLSSSFSLQTFQALSRATVYKVSPRDPVSCNVTCFYTLCLAISSGKVAPAS